MEYSTFQIPSQPLVFTAGAGGRRENISSGANEDLQSSLWFGTTQPGQQFSAKFPECSSAQVLHAWLIQWCMWNYRAAQGNPWRTKWYQRCSDCETCTQNAILSPISSFITQLSISFFNLKLYKTMRISNNTAIHTKVMSVWADEKVLDIWGRDSTKSRLLALHVASQNSILSTTHSFLSTCQSDPICQFIAENLFWHCLTFQTIKILWNFIFI